MTAPAPDRLDGIHRIQVPSSDFAATVAFLEETMGYPRMTSQRSEDDQRFLRRAAFRCPNGIILEAVEPGEECSEVFTHPIPSIRVRRFNETRTRLEAAGASFLTEATECGGDGVREFFRDPAGTLWELSARSTVHHPNPVDEFTEGVGWILAPSTSFDTSVEFFEGTMGLPVKARGTPVTDLQFQRYAQFQLPNGMILESVEPVPDCEGRFSGPVVTLTVSNLNQSIDQLERQGMRFLTSPFDSGDGWAWIYFQLPGSTTFQLQGPYPAPT